MASLTRSRSVPTTIPNHANFEYYVQRARSAGLVMTEGTLIVHQGTNWPNAAGIWSMDHARAWKRITDEVHNVGGKIFCQLWHKKLAEKPVPGPSAVQARGGEGLFERFGLDKSAGYSMPEPIEDPMAIIADYKNAALMAKEAGFDGVELHSANGYLVHQFLDFNTNKRTDKWGGSVENRCRFGLETLKALISVWGPDRVGIKMNPCGGYDDVGMPLEETKETFTYYIEEILKLKVAYIQLVNYLPQMDPELDGKKRGTPHDVLKTYGPLVKDPSNPSASNTTKLLLNGALNPDQANELISSQLIDAAVFGTLWIGNPDLQTRVEQGKELNMQLDHKTFYGFPGNDPKVGYSDYPDAV
ncbi:hypothetical protein M407DRAFT_242997 [Tulasnella calospora MUT 4182]|uniref:NADH:flavin oxidoreductase/NADH oxidase N-terminal domain-containing protein n=1 Tax=Tulasnella calospora MUT 4182 TaxID=1051891 RepID=A0A0C3QCJ7_9AGAM|nr:hypothetical protein M407DRAFT_242997 [Tulasnella calospora MUT 4182]